MELVLVQVERSSEIINVLILANLVNSLIPPDSAIIAHSTKCLPMENANAEMVSEEMVSSANCNVLLTKTSSMVAALFASSTPSMTLLVKLVYVLKDNS